MTFFKKSWHPAEADEWSVQDLWASVLSVATYVLLMLGTARAFLLKWDGFVMLLLGGICMVVMILVIDPKLKALSSDYEAKQAQYLDALERKVRRED